MDAIHYPSADERSTGNFNLFIIFLETFMPLVLKRHASGIKKAFKQKKNILPNVLILEIEKRNVINLKKFVVKQFFSE